METSSSFGYWIRRQRKVLDLTQQMLADQVGCSLAAIKKIESDERRPSRQIAERLLDVLRVPAGERERFLEWARGIRLPEDRLMARHPAEPKQGRSRPSGTVTFLFTDIEGSTRLALQHADMLPALLARHQQILKQAMEANQGFIFQVAGDSFSVAFDNVNDALKAALAAQRGLHSESWSPAAIKVRMGIHAGSANLADDPLIQGPYSGYATLALTQRIMSAAHGGQILISQAARDLMPEHLSLDAGFRDLGEHRLKDLMAAVHLYQAAAPDLPSDFPPLKTSSPLLHNLPLQLTSFIGRERELAALEELIAKTHMLTLIGPGGTGKTRLAFMLAEQLLPAFSDGVWVVELAPLSDPALIHRAIAEVFELRELPNMRLADILTDYLRTKQLLIILDNCEHMVEACAGIAQDLLRSSPRLKILASSREALGIPGETVFRVPSLSLPTLSQQSSEALSSVESARLFVERATAVHSKFELTDGNAAAVAQICQRLDGIPLALELAAARAIVLSAQEIASRLGDRFKLLAGGSRTAVARQQTLRAMIDWSYDLLPSEEQRLFRQLSVFADGWTLDAAESICPELDVLNLLTQLVNKSLVMADPQGQISRYRLLETIRQYARDRLLESGEAAAVRRRHLDYYLGLAEEAEGYVNRPQETAWSMLLDEEIDNLRAAMEWSVEDDLLKALRLGGAVHWFWERRGHELEGKAYLAEVLARTPVPLPGNDKGTADWKLYRAKALAGYGLLAFGQGDHRDSLKALEEAADLCHQIGEKSILASALTYLGMTRAFMGDMEAASHASQEALKTARELQDEAILGLVLSNRAGVAAMAGGNLEEVRGYSDKGLELLREAGSQWALAMAAFGFSMYAASQSDYIESRSQLESCIPMFAELRDRHRLAMVNSELAHLDRRHGHYWEAKLRYQGTIREWQRIGQRAAVAHEIECLAFIARAEQQDLRAARLLGAAESLRENIKIPMTPLERREYDVVVADLRANMDAAVLAKAWAEGRALDMERAVEVALEDDPGLRLSGSRA